MPTSLAQIAADHGLKWSLEPSTRTSALCPVSAFLKLTLTLEDGKTCETHFNPNAAKLDNMLAIALREHAPAHPARQAWLEAKGNYPVGLLLKTKEDFRCIGAPMHTALRKLCDSDSSVLTWNALHHLAEQDLDDFWTVAANAVRRAFADKQTAVLRQVATELRDSLLEFLEGTDEPRKGDPKLSATIRRKEAELFALRTLSAGCRLTDMDEWMWGWLGYVVEKQETGS